MISARGINRGVIPDLSRPDGDSDFYFVAGRWTGHSGHLWTPQIHFRRPETGVAFYFMDSRARKDVSSTQRFDELTIVHNSPESPRGLPAPGSRRAWSPSRAIIGTRATLDL